MYLRSGCYTGRARSVNLRRQQIETYPRSPERQKGKKLIQPPIARPPELDFIAEESDQSGNSDQDSDIALEDIEPFNMAQEQRRNIDTRMKPANFSGLGVENARSFLERFEVFCTLNEIADDDAKIGYFRLCISGPCENWLALLPAANKDTWAHLEQAFRDRFVNARNAWGEEQLLENRVQKENEPVELYMNDIQTMGYKLNKDEQTIKKAIIRGLLPKLKGNVISHNPATLEETMSQAKIAEMCEGMTALTMQTVQMKGINNNADTVEQISTKLSQEFKALGSEITGEIKKGLHQAASVMAATNSPSANMNSYDNGRQGANFEGKPQYTQQPAQPVWNGGQRSRQPFRQPPYCNNCLSTGHTWQQCRLANRRPAQQRRPNMQNIECFKCGMKGHIARMCRRNVPGRPFRNMNQRYNQQPYLNY